MYGADAYGSVPYGASSFGPEDVFDAAAMLAASRAQFVYTVELKVWDIANDVEETLYFGSAMWPTLPTDVPASQPFDGVLQSYSFTRSMLGDRIGPMVTGTGSLVLANADGAYDTIVDTYAVDAREFTVRVGRKTDAWANHLVIGRGQATSWFADTSSVTVNLRDFGFLLDIPAQGETYAGTGGAEGGADLAGLRKPRQDGLIANGAQPTLVQPALLIYQITSEPLNLFTGITGVFDRGVQLSGGFPSLEYPDYASLAASTPSAGQFASCNAEGLFKLGATPDGIVFCSASGALENAEEIARYVLQTRCGLADGDIDLSGFHVLTAVVGVVQATSFHSTSDSATAGDIISSMLTCYGAWGGFNRAGHFDVGLTWQVGTPVAYVGRDEGDIITLAREPLPSGIWPPPWRFRVGYRPSFTVFTDFAGSVPDDVRARYAQPYLIATEQHPDIIEDHPLAQDPAPIETGLYNAIDAERLAERLLDLYSSGKHLYRLTVPRTALRWNLGDAIHITHPRFGLSGGKTALIVAMTDKIEIGAEGGSVDQVEVIVFG